MPKNKLKLHYQKYYDAQVIHLDNGLIICRKENNIVRSYNEVEKFEKYFKLFFKQYEAFDGDISFNIKDFSNIIKVSSFKLKKLKEGILKIENANSIMRN